MPKKWIPPHPAKTIRTPQSEPDSLLVVCRQAVVGERVVTVYAPPEIGQRAHPPESVQPAGRPNRAFSEDYLERYRKLRASGATPHEVRRVLRIGTTAYDRLAEQANEDNPAAPRLNQGDQTE